MQYYIASVRIVCKADNSVEAIVRGFLCHKFELISGHWSQTVYKLHNVK